MKGGVFINKNSTFGIPGEFILLRNSSRKSFEMSYLRGCATCNFQGITIKDPGKSCFSAHTTLTLEQPHSCPQRPYSWACAHTWPHTYSLSKAALPHTEGAASRSRHEDLFLLQGTAVFHPLGKSRVKRPLGSAHAQPAEKARFLRIFPDFPPVTQWRTGFCFPKTP